MVPEEYLDHRSGCLRTGKSKFEMMEQARRREQVPKPEPPPDGYTEIAAPFGGHALMDLKNMLLAVLLFVFYGLAVEYAGTHPFLNGGEKLFIVFLLTVLTCCAAIRIYRRVYFGYRIYLPEDSTGMVVYNWYWGRRFFFSVPDPALQRLRIRVFRRSV